MPLGFGLQQHNDNFHVDTAKRKGPGGVAGIDDTQALQITALREYVADWDSTLVDSPHCFHVIEDAAGKFSMCSNAVLYEGVWRRNDIAKEAYRMALSPEDGFILLYWVPAGDNPIVWHLVGQLGALQARFDIDGSGLVDREFREDITIPIGLLFADSAANMEIKNKTIWGVAYKVIQEPNQGPGALRVGDVGDLSRFCSGRPAFLNAKGNSFDGLANAGGIWTPTVNRKIRISIDIAPTATPLIVRVRVIYLDMHDFD